MTAAAWISLGFSSLGVLGQLLVAAFFFGRIQQNIRDLVGRADRGDKRVDTIELRLNDHTERIAWLEGRAKGKV